MGKGANVQKANPTKTCQRELVAVRLTANTLSALQPHRGISHWFGDASGEGTAVRPQSTESRASSEKN